MVNRVKAKESHTMGQVKFYSMTLEEYERLRKELEQGVDGVEEQVQKRQAFEDSIFFIEPKEGESDGSTR